MPLGNMTGASVPRSSPGLGFRADSVLAAPSSDSKLTLTGHGDPDCDEHWMICDGESRWDRRQAQGGSLLPLSLHQSRHYLGSA